MVLTKRRRPKCGGPSLGTVELREGPLTALLYTVLSLCWWGRGQRSGQLDCSCGCVKFVPWLCWATFNWTIIFNIEPFLPPTGEEGFIHYPHYAIYTKQWWNLHCELEMKISTREVSITTRTLVLCVRRYKLLICTCGCGHGQKTSKNWHQT